MNLEDKIEALQTRIVCLAERVQLLERRMSKLERSPTRSIMDLKDIMQAKERIALDLRNQHYAQAALGGHWDTPEFKKEYFKLKSEIKEINQQLAKL